MALAQAESTVKMVFVYGTLKGGHYNNPVMDRANGRLIGKYTTDPEFTMVSLGAYPAVLEGGTTGIVGEVFEVDSLTPLDRLEGYPGFYNRKVIDTVYGPAWVYFLSEQSAKSMRRREQQFPTIESGEWEGSRYGK